MQNSLAPHFRRISSRKIIKQRKQKPHVTFKPDLGHICLTISAWPSANCLVDDFRQTAIASPAETVLTGRMKAFKKRSVPELVNNPSLTRERPVASDAEATTVSRKGLNVSIQFILERCGSIMFTRVSYLEAPI